MSAKKRLVLLIGDGLEHRFVANALGRAADLEAILVDVRRTKRNWKRAWRGGLGLFSRKVARGLYLEMIGDAKRRSRALREVFAGGGELAFEQPEKVREVPSVNSKVTGGILDEIAPDLILVYGTRIVKDKILHRAKDLALNMHTGLSPWYRGTRCAFWPIVNGEPGMIGATVHECTSAVDGGQIFATGRARLRPDDGVHHAFGRAVEIGAEIYAEVVGRYLDGKLEGERQDLSLGREYRSADLSLGAEMRARREIRRGLIRRHAETVSAAESAE